MRRPHVSCSGRRDCCAVRWTADPAHLQPYARVRSSSSARQAYAARLTPRRACSRLSVEQGVRVTVPSRTLGLRWPTPDKKATRSKGACLHRSRACSMLTMAPARVDGLVSVGSIASFSTDGGGGLLCCNGFCVLELRYEPPSLSAVLAALVDSMEGAEAATSAGGDSFAILLAAWRLAMAHVGVTLDGDDEHARCLVLLRGLVDRVLQGLQGVQESFVLRHTATQSRFRPFLVRAHGAQARSEARARLTRAVRSPRRARATSGTPSPPRARPATRTTSASWTLCAGSTCRLNPSPPWRCGWLTACSAPTGSAGPPCTGEAARGAFKS
jgi:hypothetical protein